MESFTSYRSGITAIKNWKFKKIVNAKLFAISPNVSNREFVKDWAKVVKSIMDTEFNELVSESSFGFLQALLVAACC